jgi:hypothetical protein
MWEEANTPHYDRCPKRRYPVGPDRARPAILYNASTVLTLTISVACMYATLYVLSLLAAAAVIDAGYGYCLRRSSGGPPQGATSGQ